MLMKPETKKTLADARARRARQDKAELEELAKEVEQAKAKLERFESEFSGLTAEEMQKDLSYDEMIDEMKRECGSSSTASRAYFIGRLGVHVAYLDSVLGIRHNQMQAEKAEKVMLVVLPICLAACLISWVVCAIMGIK